jgi:hypothetical protein
MKRREFLAASAVAAGTIACSPPAPKPDDETAQAQALRTNLKGVQLLFHGLTFFAVPADANKQSVDVGFIDTQINAEVAKHVEPHAPTLVVPKSAIHKNSNAIPTASDMFNAYYALRGPVLMVATTTASPGDGWGEAPSLKWKNTKPTNPSPPNCQKGSDWKNLGWLLDFKDLHAKAALPTDWPNTKAFLGVLTLRSGELETNDVPEDGMEQYTYALDSTPRLLKDTVRCYVKPAADFVQFKFGTPQQSTSVIVACKTATSPVRAAVFHLPTPGTEPMAGGPLHDYWALYEGLLSAADLAAIGAVEKRKTLSDRSNKNCVDRTPRSGGCGAVRLTV